MENKDNSTLQEKLMKLEFLLKEKNLEIDRLSEIICQRENSLSWKFSQFYGRYFPLNSYLTRFISYIIKKKDVKICEPRLRNFENVQTNLNIRYGHLRTDKNKNFFDAITKYNEPNATNPNIDMWINFALSTNERGRLVAEIIKKYYIKDRNYLDIGIGCGGFLVAFSENGAKVSGIDISIDLLNLAESNFKDNKISPKTYVKDITKREDIEFFSGSIDIITCNDVIEHVEDPDIAIRNIAYMLKKGGVAYFEIPNRYYPSFIMKDGHYSLFGITLLDYNDAKKYFLLSFPDHTYDVQHYLLIEEYQKLFKKAGLYPEILNESYTNYDKQSIINDVYNLKNNKINFISNIPKEMNALLSEKLDLYIEKALKDSTQINDDDFKLCYGTSFWKVIAKKI